VYSNVFHGFGDIWTFFSTLGDIWQDSRPLNAHLAPLCRFLPGRGSVWSSKFACAQGCQLTSNPVAGTNGMAFSPVDAAVQSQNVAMLMENIVQRDRSGDRKTIRNHQDKFYDECWALGSGRWLYFRKFIWPVARLKGKR